MHSAYSIRSLEQHFSISPPPILLLLLSYIPLLHVYKTHNTVVSFFLHWTVNFPFKSSFLIFYVYLHLYNFWYSSFLFVDPHFHLESFSFFLMDFFNIPCSAGLLVINSSIFWHSKKVYFTLTVEGIFTKHRIVGWQGCFFQHSKGVTPLSSLLHCFQW